MTVYDVFCLLTAIPVVLGLCHFPSEIVNKQYEYFDGSATTKFTKTHQLIEQELHDSIVVTSFSCVERNGDFFIIRDKYSYYCLKFTSTNSSTPQGYAIAVSNNKLGYPILCELCVRKNPSEAFRLSEHISGEPYPTLLPFGCNIPVGCKIQNKDDYLCTLKNLLTEEVSDAFILLEFIKSIAKNIGLLVTHMVKKKFQAE